jgi:hypothetical protein
VCCGMDWWGGVGPPCASMGWRLIAECCAIGCALTPRDCESVRTTGWTMTSAGLCLVSPFAKGEVQVGAAISDDFRSIATWLFWLSMAKPRNACIRLESANCR